jgi:hypothetical protein
VIVRNIELGSRITRAVSADATIAIAFGLAGTLATLGGPLVASRQLNAMLIAT